MADVLVDERLAYRVYHAIIRQSESPDRAQAGHELADVLRRVGKRSAVEIDRCDAIWCNEHVAAVVSPVCLDGLARLGGGPIPARELVQRIPEHFLKVRA